MDDAIMEALGSLIEYADTGGVCVREGCENDAPRLRIDQEWRPLVCGPHADEEQAERDRLELEARVEAFMLRSGCTPRMERFSFASYRRDCGGKEGLAALAVAEAWVAGYVAQAEEDRRARLDGRRSREISPSPNILMNGPVGCGKTGLGWSMVRAICEAGHQARIVNFAELLTAMRDCFDRHEPTKHALGAHTAKVLVLDDVGAERQTEWACEQLLLLVNARYEAGLPTVYISNYEPAVIATRLGREDEALGQRVVSRMREGATRIVFKRGDLRKRS